MKQYIQALSVLALATAVSSCADYNMEDFNIAKPESIAQYEYLNDYDVLKSYVDRAQHPGFHHHLCGLENIQPKPGYDLLHGRSLL